MKLNLSLRQRIVFGFSIQTLLIFFVVYQSVTSYVNYIEQSVVYEYFDRYLDAYLDDEDHQRAHVIPEGIRIFVPNDEQLPTFARDLPEGGQEVMLDNGEAFHVYNKRYAGEEYTLIADQTDFERLEITINNVTLLLMGVLTLVSIMFSLTLANRIVLPIKQLANRVAKLNVQNIKHFDLEYANDEVGSLVAIIQNQLSTLGYYLQREKWFTGDISHELRTPVMIISSSVDLLKQGRLSDQQERKIYQRIDAAVAQVNELINTFLLLARDKSTQQNILTQTDVHELAVKVVDSLSEYAKEQQVRLVIVPQSPVVTQVNGMFLSVVLSNLIKNAMFNARGGEIHIELQPDSVKVCDSGKGLTDFIKQYVNDSEVTDQRENRHLGLGLSIVKRVCEKENWMLTAFDSDLGGAGFLVSFSAQ